jgi:hypothetical protein
MTEYRIAEEHNRFHIQELIKKDPFNSSESWRDLSAIPRVPRFFDSLADARSWVATIKRGVVYHDAEDAVSDAVNDAVNDAPNLAQDERKAEDDTSDGIKPLRWFMERMGRTIMRKTFVRIEDEHIAMACHNCQADNAYRYSDIKG